MVCQYLTSDPHFGDSLSKCQFCHKSVRSISPLFLSYSYSYSDLELLSQWGKTRMSRSIHNLFLLNVDIILSSVIQVPFLNLMQNIIERSGGVVVRIGGNTQEFATMVPFIEDGMTFSKEDSGSTQTVCIPYRSPLLFSVLILLQTKTPAVLYTIDMFYMASNISSMINVKWFFGKWRFIFSR